MSEKRRHPIVFRFASIFPAALARIEMHAKRSGGPLENIELQFAHRNKVFVGETFAKEMGAEIRAMKQKNLDEEVAACHARKRKKEAAARLELGLLDPWHGNSQGPIREAIVTANWQYFEADDLSKNEDILITYGVGTNGEEVEHRLSKAKIAAFEAATLQFFDQYFPGSVRHLRLDLDEETPHFHAVILETAEKTNKTRGTQQLIQPSANPLLADYEFLQDVAGEHFSSIGLTRGQKRAQDVRDAKESELPLPDAVRHTTPREYRNARANTIRAKELDLKEQEKELRARDANVFLDEVTADAKLAQAAQVEQEARKTQLAAQLKLAEAARTVKEADDYAKGMTDGVEAIMAYQLDYQPDDQRGSEHLCDGPQALEHEQQAALWKRIQPAYDRLLAFAKKAFQFRERVFAVRHSEQQVSRRAKIVAKAEQLVGRPIGKELSAVITEAEAREYEEADFPGAWAVPRGADRTNIEKRLNRMTNRTLLNCYLATRDAADLTTDGQTVHSQFIRGRQVLEYEAKGRGFNFETGRHDPNAASDPKRARLHLDEDTRGFSIKLRNGQRQLTRH